MEEARDLVRKLLALVRGDALCELPSTRFKGLDDPRLFHVISRLKEHANEIGYRVYLDPLPGSMLGACGRRLGGGEGEIILNELLSSLAVAARVLTHELTHAKLHPVGFEQAQAEVEAESVAFCVTQALGIPDQADFSLSYIKGWGEDGTVERIDAARDRIAETADELLAIVRASA